MRQKPINVKVQTVKVVKALQKSLDTRKKILADAEKSEKEHEKAMADFEKSIVELVVSGKAKVVKVDKAHYYGRENTRTEVMELRVEVPKSLCPKEKVIPNNRWGIDSEIQEIENAIKILEMTDEEYISTSTYAGVARFI